MASGPDVPGDPPPESSPDPTPLDPEAERLFGFGTDAWAAKIRGAHQQPGPAHLGPYELLGEVGRGGQGEVYRAVQPGTGRMIALKRIAGLGLAPDPALLARFTREVEALTRLSHPNVVTVYTIDAVDGHTVLVMEFVDGRHIDLWADAQWVGSVEPVRAVLGVFAKACDGVAHAHQRGVIHRDIKPSNILVTAESQPKVLDFGIARILGEQAAAEAKPVFTVTGFAGTPAYASPEQLTPGGGIDTRSDVYSLGVLLYRMLTGKEAFEGSIAESARLKAESPAPHPRRIRPNVPTECDWIVRKATDPDPARRYATVESLAEDVRRLLDGRAVAAHPPSVWYSTRRAIGRRPWLSSGIAATVVTVSALGIVAGVQAARLSVRSADLADALKTANEQKGRAERGEQRQITLNQRVLQSAMATVSAEYFLANTEPNQVKALAALVQQLTPEDDENTVVELRLRYAIALVNARKYAEALVQIVAARAISDRIDDPTGERVARLVSRHWFALEGAGKSRELLPMIDRAISRAAGRTRTIFVACLHWLRLSTLDHLKRPDEEVFDFAREVIARFDEHPSRAFERAKIREVVSEICSGRHRYELAEQLARDALDISAKHRVEQKTVSRLNFKLGIALIAQGRWQEAEPPLRAASDYRLKLETANGSRGHLYIRLHAEALHRLGRFEEAAPRWQLSIASPLSRVPADERLIATLRLRLAAATFGAGAPDAARIELARALSLGRSQHPEAPEVAERIRAIESALRSNGWRVNTEVQRALEDLGWMAQAPDGVARSTESPFDLDD